MTFTFLENEFTTAEILYFLKKAYGKQINCKPFTSAIISNWIRIRHFPLVYGGYRIISSSIYKEYGRIRTLMLDGLTRIEAEEMIGSLEDAYNKPIKSTKELKPRKHRTKLYYQVLESAGKQYTKKTIKEATLPTCWKLAGIKTNQTINKKRS